MRTRLREPIELDEEKLTRCLQYLNNTKHLGIVLSAKDDVAGNICVSSCIDATYGVHGMGRAIPGGKFTLLARDRSQFDPARRRS